MFGNKILLPAIVLALGLSSACTKKAKEKSGIKIDFSGRSQSQTLSTSDIFKIAINVKGTNSIYWSWESCHCSANETPPTQVQLQTNPSDGELIQVIAVADSDSGLIIYYGDAVVSLKPGTTTTADINVVNVVSSQKSAELMGRYYRSDGSHPTGTVQMTYRPPNNKPEMIVHESAMIAGWTSLHIFQSTLIDFKIKETGEALLSSVNYGSFSLGDKMMRVDVPIHYRDEYHDQISPYEEQNPEDYFIGFFGPGASSLSGKAVCYPTSTSISNVFTTSSGSSTLGWNATSADATKMARVGGGVAVATAPCTTGTEFTDIINFHPTQLGSSGKDGLVGYRQIFKNYTGTYGMTPGLPIYDPNTVQSYLEWTLLPGTASVLSGIRVFTKIDANYQTIDDTIRSSEGYACDQLSALGFSSVQFSPTSTSVPLANVNANNSSQAVVIVCPVSNTGILMNAMAVRIYDAGYPIPTFGNGNDGTVNISGTLEYVSSATYQRVVSGTTTNQVFSASRKVDAISADGKTLTLFSVNPNSGSNEYEFQVNDEVLWHVASESGNGCGSLDAGKFGSAYIRDLSETSDTITLNLPIVNTATGTLPSALTATNLTGTTHCHMTVTRVPNFQDLTLSSGLTLTTNTLGGDASGILTFKVAGTLTTTSSYATLKATSGYSASFTAGKAGSGLTGIDLTGGPVATSNGGGGSITVASGGGGAGPWAAGGGGGADSSVGGQGGVAPCVGATGNDCHPKDTGKIFHGGAGGNGIRGSSFSGGRGGGIIVASARTLDISSGKNINFEAHGFYGATDINDYTDSGGGGGGGTIAATFRTISGATLQTSSFSAIGGSGGGSVGAGSTAGGGGGGGLVFIDYCSSYGSLNASPPSVGGGPSGSSAYSGVTGANGDYAFASSGQFCNLP